MRKLRKLLKERRARKVEAYRARARREFAALPQEERDYWEARTRRAIEAARSDPSYRAYRESPEGRRHHGEAFRAMLTDMAESPLHGLFSPASYDFAPAEEMDLIDHENRTHRRRGNDGVWRDVPYNERRSR